MSGGKEVRPLQEVHKVKKYRTGGQVVQEYWSHLQKSRMNPYGKGHLFIVISAQQNTACIGLIFVAGLGDVVAGLPATLSILAPSLC